MLCDTRTMLFPCPCSSTRIFSIVAVPFGSSPAVGSSSTSTSGRMASTPASATRRFSPSLSLCGFRSLNTSGARPTCSRASRTRFSTVSSGSPRFRGPNATSFATVSSKSCISGNWNTRPIRRRMSARSTPRRLMSTPSTSTRPRRGVSRAVKCCKSVVLPEPDRPTSPTNSPCWIFRETPRSTSRSEPRTPS